MPYFNVIILIDHQITVSSNTIRFWKMIIQVILLYVQDHNIYEYIVIIIIIIVKVKKLKNHQTIPKITISFFRTKFLSARTT